MIDNYEALDHEYKNNFELAEMAEAEKDEATLLAQITALLAES